MVQLSSSSVSSSSRERRQTGHDHSDINAANKEQEKKEGDYEVSNTSKNSHVFRTQSVVVYEKEEEDDDDRADLLFLRQTIAEENWLGEPSTTNITSRSSVGQRSRSGIDFVVAQHHHNEHAHQNQTSIQNISTLLLLPVVPQISRPMLPVIGDKMEMSRENKIDDGEGYLSNKQKYPTNGSTFRNGYTYNEGLAHSARTITASTLLPDTKVSMMKRSASYSAGWVTPGSRRNNSGKNAKVTAEGGIDLSRGTQQEISMPMTTSIPNLYTENKADASADPFVVLFPEDIPFEVVQGQNGDIKDNSEVKDVMQSVEIKIRKDTATTTTGLTGSSSFDTISRGGENEVLTQSEIEVWDQDDSDPFQVASKSKEDPPEVTPPRCIMGEYDNEMGQSQPYDYGMDHPNGSDWSSDIVEKDLASKTKYTFWQRRAMHLAKNPYTYFFIPFAIALALSAIGMTMGNFKVVVKNYGWQSRGTEIADRSNQLLLVRKNDDKLWGDSTGQVWQDMTSRVQPGWETSSSSSSSASRRLNLDSSKHNVKISNDFWEEDERPLPFEFTPDLERKLQTNSNNSFWLTCETSYYFRPRMYLKPHLWPIWRVTSLAAKQSPNVTFLSGNVIRDICWAESRTQQLLVDRQLCWGCNSTDRCLPPFSPVLYAHLEINDFELKKDCNELGVAWDSHIANNEPLRKRLIQCAQDLRTAFRPVSGQKIQVPRSCPFGFLPTLVDDSFDQSGNGDAIFTSSIFFTNEDKKSRKQLFNIAAQYDRGTELVQGVFDTQREDFVNTEISNSIGHDMTLCVLSAFITAMALAVHTRSLFLSTVGLFVLIVSFPLAYFFYAIVFGLQYFPFLNFIGVFVAFALGSDYVFVAVDKWKNARLLNPTSPITEVAALALPDAADAMFLTSFTTAVAFFSTATCMIAPLNCFAIFLGLLISMEYFLCVLLVFPALCMYDNWKDSHFCRRHVEKQTGDSFEGNEKETGDSSHDKTSLIHRILSTYYFGMHKVRYLLLIALLAALGVCLYFCLKLRLPTSSSVRLLPGHYEYEQNYQWRQQLLSTAIGNGAGSSAYFVWGVKPADTGKHNNPYSWTQLVLDESFDPSTESAQVYLRDFCPRLYEKEFASKPAGNYSCTMNLFDAWLQQQANSTAPSQIYLNHCAGARGLPMAQDSFNACLYYFGQDTKDTTVLARNKTIKIMYISFTSRASTDSNHKELYHEWHTLENFTRYEADHVAPEGVSKMFFSSDNFWWYDTNNALLRGCFSSVAITYATALFVIFCTSRSLVLTLFSFITIVFVLLSVTAAMVARGWTLGFLEAICFAILIGISCDFVIHFSHAYAAKKGNVGRSERTMYALIHMGPSILAGAFTTIAGATVMWFTVITFFRKFAFILFMTILMSTGGSFLIFLVLADCFGPAQPTYMIDKCVDKVIRSSNSQATEPELKNSSDSIESNGVISSRCEV